MKVRELITRLLDCDMDAFVYVVDGDSLKFITWKPILRGKISHPSLGYPLKSNFIQTLSSDGYYNSIILTWD